MFSQISPLFPCFYPLDKSADLYYKESQKLLVLLLYLLIPVPYVFTTEREGLGMKATLHQLHPSGISRREFLKLGIATTAVTWAFPHGLTAQETGLSLWMNTLFWGGDAQAMERIIKQLNQEQGKQIFVTLTQGQWEVYYTQLVNAVVAGNPPQIGIVHTNRLPLVEAALTPLEKSRAGNLLEVAGIKGTDYVQTLWEGGVYQGNRYLIPLDTHMWGLWYNKDLFKEAGLDPENPPNTREEFEAAANAIRDKTGKIAFHPADAGKPRMIRRAWFILLWQQGGELFDQGYTKATFNDEKGLHALEYLVSMVRETAQGGKGWNKPGTDGVKQFTAGQLGMLLTGNWFYWTAEQSGVNYGFHYIPQFFDRRVTWGNSHNLVIPKQAEGVKDEVLVAAAKVIKWIGEHSDTWGIYGGHIPAYKPVLQSPALRESKTWQACLKKFADMADTLGAFRYDVIHPQLAKIFAALEPPLEEAYNGTLTPSEALNRAEQAVNKVLAEG